jgi:hypothetical protein
MKYWEVSSQTWLVITIASEQVLASSSVWTEVMNFFKAGLQCHTINNGSKHAHIIAMTSFNTSIRFISAAVNITTANRYRYFHTNLCQQLYICRILSNHIIVKTKIVIAHLRFAGKFQQNSLILWNHVPIDDLGFIRLRQIRCEDWETSFLYGFIG